MATRYSWHRDEFYYVICGRHPAWVRRPATADARWWARWPRRCRAGCGRCGLVAIAAQVACILLTALLAAQFGGRPRAQAIAAAAVAGTPIFVGASALYGTAVTDQVFWLLILVLVARALRLGETSAWGRPGWPPGGTAEQSTVVILLAGILLGLIMFRRDALRGPGPWLAGGIAVLVAVPNLVWNARHGWPDLEMARVLSRRRAVRWVQFSSYRSCWWCWPGRCWWRCG